MASCIGFVLGVQVEASVSGSVSGDNFTFSSGTYYPPNDYYSHQYQKYHKKPLLKAEQVNRPNNYNMGDSSMTNSPSINHNKNPVSCVKTIKSNGVRTYQQAIPCTMV